MGINGWITNSDILRLEVLASLHTADPGDTGLAEVACPGYQRQEIRFVPAQNGDIAAEAPLRVPLSVPVYGALWVGLWENGELVGVGHVIRTKLLPSDMGWELSVSRVRITAAGWRKVGR